MSSTISPTVSNALISLGIKLWNLGGEPSNETEFLSMFKKEMSNNNGEVVYSNSPSDFGVTWSQVKTALDTLQAEYDANQYQRDRQYPTWQEQMDMQYHDEVDGTTTWKDAIAKVKSDNPKP